MVGSATPEGLCKMGSQNSVNNFPERQRVHEIGDVLNYYLPILARPYIHQILKGHLDMVLGPNGYLVDSRGDLLRFDPDNQPTPPNGRGIQLCFKVLEWTF